ncbi:hypothetical protein KA068_01405 [Candidatus Saccharibacteria bacterium]|nr:hypothetical protein [Candidatus Saccharibacteria bacterium]
MTVTEFGAHSEYFDPTDPRDVESVFAQLDDQRDKGFSLGPVAIDGYRGGGAQQIFADRIEDEEYLLGDYDFPYQEENSGSITN